MFKIYNMVLENFTRSYGDNINPCH